MLKPTVGPRLALAATQVLCEGSAFLRNLILARIIGAEEMGLAVALALGIRILEMAGDFGLDRLLVQVDDSALPAMRRTVHLLQLAKGCALAALAVALAAPVTAALDPALDPAVFALAALSFALRGAVNFDYRERQRRQEFVPALAVEGGSNLIAALATAPLAWLARDYTALAWGSLLQAVLLCGLSQLIATRRLALGIEREALRRCLRYGLPIALNGALMFLAMQGDRVIVALHFPAQELARFAIAAQLTLLPALIGARYVLASALPRLARLVGDPAAFGREESELLLTTSLVAAGGMLLFGAGGSTIVSLLYGSAYVMAPEMFWLLAVTAGLRLIRAVPGTSLLAFERTQMLFASNLPRLLTVALAFGIAAAGGDLAAIALIGVAGEAASLAIALFAAAAARSRLSAVRPHRLAEGI
jgi:O-antigen/teichoic acid export membrane protein